jgi:hypothetical protein
VLLILDEIQSSKLRTGKADSSSLGVACLKEFTVYRSLIAPVQRCLLLNMELWESGHNAKPLWALMGSTQHFSGAEKTYIIRLPDIGHKLVDVIDCRNYSLCCIMRRNNYIETAIGLGDDSSLTSPIKVISDDLRIKARKGRGYVL